MPIIKTIPKQGDAKRIFILLGLLLYVLCEQPNPSFGQSNSVQQAKNILLILDTSSSMNEHFRPGQTKMDKATKLVFDLLKVIPADRAVGLRVFGQGISESEISNCTSTTLLKPISLKRNFTSLESLKKLAPSGLSPLKYTLQLAIEKDFSDLTGTALIILVTNGTETCGGQFSELATLANTRKIRVVPVILSQRLDSYAGKALLNLAEKTAGKFYDHTKCDLVVEEFASAND